MKKRMSQRLTAMMLVMALAMVFSGCTENQENDKNTATEDMTTEATAIYHKLSPEEAKARMDSGDPLIILDVRTQEEYDAGHIPDALLLPNEEIGTEMPSLLPDKDAEILVYCRSGNRSAQAVNKLVNMGYTAAYDFGGINSWPYDIVTE